MGSSEEEGVMGSEHPVIEMNSLWVVYDHTHPALVDVSVVVDKPEFIIVIGPNGAGKTTLLKVLLGMIKPTKGWARVFGFDVVREAEEIRRLTGYVPQRDIINFEVPLSVKDVVLMGLLPKKRIPRIPSSSDLKRVEEALEFVGMGDLWEEKFSDLSGGQQQRVLLARALVSEPKLLLLDEPLSAVDVASQDAILRILRHLREEGTTIVMVSHDINPVVEYVDKIMLLNKRVVAYGTPSEVIREEVFSEAYGYKVKIIEHAGVCYAITGDVHA